MSQTYSIACKDCQKHIWMAQARHSEKKSGHVYTTPEHAKNLFEFLIDHEGHELLFGQNCDEPILDYEEVYDK